jgi:hypothetical protein
MLCIYVYIYALQTLGANTLLRFKGKKRAKRTKFLEEERRCPIRRVPRGCKTSLFKESLNRHIVHKTL